MVITKTRLMVPSPSCRFEASRSTTDDWTAIDDKKQRKKIQNRTNQRIRRQRISEKKSQNPQTVKRPYQVDRWRIESPTAANSGNTIFSTRDDPPKRVELSRSSSYTALPPTTSEKNQHDSDSKILLTLPSDHLLHLIHYNVLRALVSNKRILRHSATMVFQHDKIDNLVRGRQLCDGPTVVHPLHPHIPNSLFPTPLQMSHFHSNWIDMFPFPEIRDNLIRWEGYFDPIELQKDLVGEVFNDNQSLTNGPRQSGSNFSQILIQREYDDTVTSGRNGLIVWGEPYVKESWEVTPGFLKKWPWVVEGCEELVRFSNYWRAIRGEEPIQLIVTSVDTHSH